MGRRYFFAYLLDRTSGNLGQAVPEGITMATAKKSIARAASYLKVFEEQWKRDHHEAMECYDLEDFITEAQMIFSFIKRAEEANRQAVFGGADVDPQISDCRGYYARWLLRAEPAIAALDRIEEKFGQVNGSDAFRDSFEHAHRVIEEWVETKPPIAVGSRVFELTESEMDQLRDLHASPPGTPGRFQGTLPERLPEGKGSDIK